MKLNRYIVVGAGGTASYLLPGLIRWLDTTWAELYELFVMDGDEVEQKNLARQVHTQQAIGMNKAEALLAAHATNDRQHALPAYLSDDNIANIITEESTVLITVDNTPCRARIQRHVKTLKNARVINGGNEEHTGSVQIWVREDKKNITPPLGFMHAEIDAPGPDRAGMTCDQVAKLPGGGQTTLANMLSATFMLQALNRTHLAPSVGPLNFHEIQFDALAATPAEGTEYIDWRTTKAWANFTE